MAGSLEAPLSAQTEAVQSVAFSSDGKTLASAGEDNMIIMWDVTNPQLPIQVGTPLLGHSEGVESVAFSPDGKTLVSAGQDFTVRLWNMDADSWRNRTCTFVGRNLTEAEWERYLPGQQYLATCSFQTVPAPSPVSTSPAVAAFATAEVTLTAETLRSPFPTAGITPLSPLLTGAVTSCDPSTRSINFRMVESPPDLTGKALLVQIEGQQVNCAVNPVNTSLLTCAITDAVSFPVTVIVTVDGVVVNNFTNNGTGCRALETPVP